MMISLIPYFSPSSSSPPAAAEDAKDADEKFGIALLTKPRPYVGGLI